MEKKKRYVLIRKFGTVIYKLNLLSENESDSLWAHNKFNMVSESVGSHLAWPKFESPICGQLV